MEKKDLTLRLSASSTPKLSVSLRGCFRLFHWVCPCCCKKNWVESRGLEEDPRRWNNLSFVLLDIILVGN